MLKKLLLLNLIILSLVLTFANVSQAANIKPLSQTGVNARSESPHWQKNTITVYIPKDSKAESIKRAFSKWQSELSGRIKFEFVSKGPADIDIVFVESLNGTDGSFGSSSVSTSGSKITKAEIQFATRGKKQFSNNYAYTVMLHEIGHALGLSDSPRKQTSIMYTPITDAQNITSIDLRTLYQIYGWNWSTRRLGN